MRRLALLLPVLASPAAGQRLDYQPVADESLAEPARLSYQEVDTPDAPVEGNWPKWVLVDRFEYSAQRGRNSYAWDVSALLGGKRHRVWLGSSGEGPAWARPDYVELNAFYSLNVGGPWDLNAGFRHDLQAGEDRSYVALGAQYDDGEALWLGAWAYASDKGELSARLAGYYNHAIGGGPVVLQPSAELDYYGEDVPELGLGRGFGYAEAGLRVRYDFKEGLLAPYLGVSWSRDLGRTARLTREEGEDPETKSLVMGLRSAF